VTNHRRDDRISFMPRPNIRSQAAAASEVLLNSAGRPDNLDTSNKTHLRIPSVRAVPNSEGNKGNCCEASSWFYSAIFARR
jgi:hypothetical protein